eukprot:m.184214 g.184214  ORF g.184214 m.184214 type:complete len:857 (+) comp25531_c0_seq1:49-2619(+)
MINNPTPYASTNKKVIKAWRALRPKLRPPREGHFQPPDVTEFREELSSLSSADAVKAIEFQETPGAKSLLHFAAMEGFCPIVECFLNEYGASVNLKSTHGTPLHLYVSRKDDKPMVHLLRKYGATINNQDNVLEETAVEVAKAKQHHTALKALEEDLPIDIVVPNPVFLSEYVLTKLREQDNEAAKNVDIRENILDVAGYLLHFCQPQVACDINLSHIFFKSLPDRGNTRKPVILIPAPQWRRTLTPQPTTVETFVERVRQHVKLRIRPDLVMELMGLADCNNTPCLMFEQPKFNLSYAIANKSDDLSCSKKWPVQILDALVFLESQGLVLPLLKPSNVFIFEDQEASYRCKVGAFLEALNLTSLNKPQFDAFCDQYPAPDPYYGSPELLSNLKPHVPDLSRCMSFSFGRLLFEILTRKTVAEMMTSKHLIFERLCKGQAEPDFGESGCPTVQMKQFIKSLWSVEPQNRPSLQSIAQTFEKNKENEEWFGDTNQIPAPLGEIEDGVLVDKGSLADSPQNTGIRYSIARFSIAAKNAGGSTSIELLPAYQQYKKDIQSYNLPVIEREDDFHEFVGSGSFGDTFEIHLKDHEASGLPRAAIEKRPKNLSQAEFFCFQARLTLDLNHDNVIKMYGVSVQPIANKRRVGLVMELAEMDVEKYLFDANRKLPVETAERWGQELVSGVCYLHDQNLVHGDLKPNNLLLASSGPGQYQIKVSDFDLLRTTDSSREKELRKELGIEHVSLPVQQEDVGSLPFMAPELHEQGATTTEASDIFALCLCLYPLCCRKLHVDGLQSLQEVRCLMAEGIKPPPNIHETFRTLFKKMMGAAPQRPTGGDLKQYFSTPNPMIISSMKEIPL